MRNIYVINIHFQDNLYVIYKYITQNLIKTKEASVHKWYKQYSDQLKIKQNSDVHNNNKIEKYTIHIDSSVSYRNIFLEDVLLLKARSCFNSILLHFICIFIYYTVKAKPGY